MTSHEYETLFGWMRANPTWAREIAAIDALRAERDALLLQVEVHKADAMREISEANDLAAKCDELQARVAALEAALGEDMLARIDAALAEHQPTTVCGVCGKTFVNQRYSCERLECPHRTERQL